MDTKSSLSSLGLTFILLLGCPPEKNDACSDTSDTAAIIWCDADGDGVSPADGDCDDTNAAIYPSHTESAYWYDGAEELCNGLDDNCDGETDEGLKSGYALDNDGDGYGDYLTVVEDACEAPPGYVANSDDCDDYNAAINPDAVEVCDREDNDCDGAIDNNAVDATTWYADVDGDENGDGATAVTSCQPLLSYVTNANDCDDTNSYVNPSAEELCDEVDNDCDNEIDEGQLSTWYYDVDGDGYSASSSTSQEACEAEGLYRSQKIGDCDDFNNDAYPDAPEVCDGADNDCDGATDNDAEDAPTWYADNDGDKYGDVSDISLGCEAPGGYIANNDDCDDNDAAVNPGAEEDCTDTNDYNCDGSVGYSDVDGDGWAACEECNDTDAAINPSAAEVCDEYDVDEDCNDLADDSDPNSDQGTWYADNDNDDYGDPSETKIACDEPRNYVANSDDCDDVDAAINPSAAEVCDEYDVDEDCNGSTDDACTDPDTGGTDDSGDTSDTDSEDSGGGDTGASHGTLMEFDFGDGTGTCASSPWTNGAGDSIPSTMTFSDGAGTCGVYIYGGGSLTGPSPSTDVLLYEGTGFTVGTEYTAEMALENTLTTDMVVYGTFGDGVVSSVTVSASSTGTLSISWTADASSADLEVWSTGTDYDVVLHGAVITY